MEGLWIAILKFAIVKIHSINYGPLKLYMYTALYAYVESITFMSVENLYAKIIKLDT